eukprot:scaffold5325_cov183-Amphora_coffeaeformis.AAC.14
MSSMLIHRSCIRRLSPQPLQAASSRSFAILGIGEGWTGALVPGELNQKVSGHFDEVEIDLPVVMYDKGPVHAVQPGWGHTALLVPHDHKIGEHQLLLTGRPFDFPNLLRLHRMPRWIRRYASKMPRDKQAKVRSMHPSILFGRVLTWLVDVYQSDTLEDRALIRDWETAEAYSLLDQWTPLETPEAPISLGCSAGFSAFGTQSGKLYSFGINTFGQCGVGLRREFGTKEVMGDEPVPVSDLTLSRIVWSPEPVVYTVTNTDGEEEIEEEIPLSLDSFALGLQHGIGLTAGGEVYCWGKGERGQLGQDFVTAQSPHALSVSKGYYLTEFSGERQKPQYREMGKVVQVAAGMIHSAALTADNEVLIWGKHVIPPLPSDAEQGKTASDSKLPCVLQGLPDKKIEKIACGSHHTAILFEDGSVYGVGFSTDSKEPIHEPMELIPTGVVDMPVRQFAAHMDRTTVVGADGRQVLQVHLWEDPDYQEVAIYTPAWVDRLLDEDSQVRIKGVHRSWLHTYCSLRWCFILDVVTMYYSGRCQTGADDDSFVVRPEQTEWTRLDESRYGIIFITVIIICNEENLSPLSLEVRLGSSNMRHNNRYCIRLYFQQ